MCLILFAWKMRKDAPLIVAANRDEWHRRAARAAAWWSSHPNILAGQDLEAHGTWLGVTRAGKFAAITNFREPSLAKTGASSRGQLAVNYLKGQKSPREYLEELTTHASEYNGYNLLLADQENMFCFSSVENKIEEVEPGIHGLSNRALNTPWPKVEIGRAALGAALEAKMPESALPERLLAILSNDAQAADAALPNTGVGLDWERKLSSALIVSTDYGTRCSTIFIGGTNSSANSTFAEHTRDVSGAVVSTAAFEFSSTAS
jgi:uncharacterized protein with NRDE domain